MAHTVVAVAALRPTVVDVGWSRKQMRRLAAAPSRQSAVNAGKFYLLAPPQLRCLFKL